MNKPVIMALVIGLVIGVIAMYGYASMTGYMTYEYGKDLPFMANQAKMINGVRQALVWDAGTIIDSNDRIVIIQGAVLNPSMKLEGNEILYVGVFDTLALSDSEALDMVKTEQLNDVIRAKLLQQGVLAEVANVDLLELRTTREILDTHRGIISASEPGQWKVLIGGIENQMLSMRRDVGTEGATISWVLMGEEFVGPLGIISLGPEKLGAAVIRGNTLDAILTGVLMQNLGTVFAGVEGLAMLGTQEIYGIIGSATTYSLPDGGNDLE